MTTANSQPAISNTSIDWAGVFKLVQKYSQSLVNRFGVSNIEQEDVASEFYCKLVASNFDPKKSNYRYLYVGVKSVILNMIRFKQSKGRYLECSSHSNTDKIFSTVHQDTSLLELHDVIKKLPNRTFNSGKVFMFDGSSFRSDYHSLSHILLLGYNLEEVARIFGVSSVTIKNVLCRMKSDCANLN